jgi:23S rRNA (uracil1939-C5)-methyltransferase
MTLCRHFGTCGGCIHQGMDDGDYRTLKQKIVTDALARHGVTAAVEDVVEVPPATRRRATMKAKLESGKLRLGFHAARTHDIVDLEECLVLVPPLTGLLPGLKDMLGDMLAPEGDAEIRLTFTEAGADLGLRWRLPNDTPTLAALARWAARLKIARISAHGETAVSLAAPVVHLGKAEVALPPETFLQPTHEGEKILQDFAVKTLGRAKKVVDLFCGCGTFSFPLAEKARVHAVELESPMLEALAAAAKTTPGLKPITTEKRNLFKRPLNALELNAYDGVCIDPPRAGALEQAKMLAKSNLTRIAYVSCDAESFARDAKVLIDGGFALQRVVPVDQFLWSSHIELAAAFVRP